MAASKFDKYTTSFSGADMIVMFLFPNAAPVTIGTASTVGYSLFRQMAQVRTLGRISAKGYGRGGVTFAGSIVFTVVNQSFMEDVKAAIPYLSDYTNIRPDELPPFDILITFANELGQSATLAIYGASFTDETTTFSVEDIFTENVLTFMARDIRHMKAGEQINPAPSASFNTNTERLGKFFVSELFATQEAKDRDAKIAEIEAAQQSRAELAISKPAWEPSAATDVSSISKGSLSVIITNDRTSGTISGVNVTVKDGNGLVQSKKTDSGGYATFSGIAEGKVATIQAEHTNYLTVKDAKSEAIKTSTTNVKNIRMTPKSGNENVPDNKPTKMVFFAPFDKEKDTLLVSRDRIKAGHWHPTSNDVPKVQLSNEVNGYNTVANCNTQFSWVVAYGATIDGNEDAVKKWIAKYGKSGSFAAQLSNANGNVSWNPTGKMPAAFKELPIGSMLRITAKVVANQAINRYYTLLVVKN